MTEETNQPERELTAHERQIKNLKPAWKPGQSGNPAGRPKGSRNKLTEDFFKALAEDFAKNGVAAIDAMRREKPGDYAKMVASLQTKEVTGEDGAPLIPTEIGWRVIKAGVDDGTS